MNINYILKSCMSVANWLSLVSIFPLADLFTIIFLPWISIKFPHLLHYFSVVGLHRSPSTCIQSTDLLETVQTSNHLHCYISAFLCYWACGYFSVALIYQALLEFHQRERTTTEANNISQLKFLCFPYCVADPPSLNFLINVFEWLNRRHKLHWQYFEIQFQMPNCT